MKCEFCGKEFKTEKGFSRHMCEKKERYVNFNTIAYRVWLTICNVFRIRLPQSQDEELLKMKFIQDKSYKAYVTFAQWLLDTSVIDVFSYITFLNTHQVAMKDWTKPNVYKSWLYEFLKNEPDALSINRSKKYLESNGLTLETISSNRLYLAIRYGWITNKYLKLQNFDVREHLDEAQWFDIRPFIISDVCERMNNALHNS